VAHRGEYVQCCVRCKETTDCGHVRDPFLGRNAIHQESESIAGSDLIIILGMQTTVAYRESVDLQLSGSDYQCECLY